VCELISISLGALECISRAGGRAGERVCGAGAGGQNPLPDPGPRFPCVSITACAGVRVCKACTSKGSDILRPVLRAGERVCEAGAGGQNPLPDPGPPAQADAGHDGQNEGAGEAAAGAAPPLRPRAARVPPARR
jgi:hypothetical protein